MVSNMKKACFIKVGLFEKNEKNGELMPEHDERVEDTDGEDDELQIFEEEGCLPRRLDHEADITHLYLAEICAKQVLTKEEEASYAVLARSGDFDARQKLIEHNLRFVVSVAKRYSGKGLPLLDLVEEGNLGLMHALEKFDPERGFRFSTYAIWWIRCFIECALNEQSRLVRVPVHIYQNHRRILRAIRDIESRNCDGRKATSEEISCHLGIDSTSVRSTLEIMINTMPVELSRNEETKYHILHNIAAPEESQPERYLSDLQHDYTVRSLVHRLPPRERLIITLRFGLDDDEPKTFDCIAEQLGISAERTRQLQGKAMDMLRDAFANLDRVVH